MNIKIKYHNDELIRLENIGGSDKSAWIDLRVAENVFIPENTFKLVSLGVSIELPKGYEAHIVPRSSTFKNFGIIQTNHMGVIDNAYCGDNDIWRFPAYCIEGRDEKEGIKGTYLKVNDRICQLRVVEQQSDIQFEEVENMNNESRGGFGITGKN